MKKDQIIIKLNPLITEIIENLQLDLIKLFNGIFEDIHIIENSKGILKKYYNKHRNQYNASRILDDVKEIGIKEEYYRVLAITSEDLYTERLNFVFGVAFMPSQSIIPESVSAIISFKRLKEEFYNLPKDNVLFRERVIKEAAHELGHTLGLKHCTNKCVMRFSNCIDDTDEKPARFCYNCLNKIKKNYGLG